MFAQRKLKPEDRRKKLRELLASKPLIRTIEVHNGISALVANNAKVELIEDNQKGIIEFDALWASSFTDSASKGLPDIEIVSFDSRLNTIEQIISVTDKPVVVDSDTGRDTYSFQHFLTKLELLGVSAVVVEDKAFPKRNSLDPDAIQNLENPDIFASKIKAGKEVLSSNDFMIFARIESLIAGAGLEDALFRAKKYLQAGAEGILVHSHDRNPDNVLQFALDYGKLCKGLGFRKPLICIPTTYSMITEKELQKYGFNIVIYGNHLLRASAKSMDEVCKTILLNGRAFETEPRCATVNTIFDIVGFNQIKLRDFESLQDQSKAKAIIPAAGKPKEEIAADTPTAMLDVNGKTVLERQLEVLKRCEINNVTVVRGYEKDKFSVGGVKYRDVSDYARGSMFSLLAAEEEMKGGFVMIFSDILFDESIINNLLRTKEDITLVVDASFPLHRHEIDKALDLVIARQSDQYYREPSLASGRELTFIGSKIKKDIATHEFIGIAKFSEFGAENYVTVYKDCLRRHKGRFHESESVEQASVIDVFEEMIQRGFKVNCVETNKGWIEIHNTKDYEIAKRIVH
jgi:phosphoenolpyruvate phosphomutase